MLDYLASPLPHAPTREAQAVPVGCALELPLSWARATVARPELTSMRLPLSGATWVTWGTLPVAYTFEQVVVADLAGLPGGFVLRGCGPKVAHFLAYGGCQIARAGLEAVLDLHGDSLTRRAVTKMVKQARRHGAVYELPWSAANVGQLRAFMPTAWPTTRPALRHLFRGEFSASTRCFIFASPAGAWRGVLLLSTPHPQTAVVELMVRAHDAPGGVMESLISAVGTTLRAEGVHTLSLNEVPFHHLDDRLSLAERLIATVGRGLLNAYHTEGLLRFKAKFAPTWRPVYLCASRRLSLALLTDLFTASGCLQLAGHSLLRGPTNFSQRA